jgi:NADH dehydrogenase/NADH:ubiquinone oxidoreductase subunit G
MNAESALKQATDAVDQAWRRWKENRNPETEAAYDQSYANWKQLAPDRGVGRPASVEQTPLTSTERAVWARSRQQQSASKWEKVAPVIQQIRRAAEAADDATILGLAKSLAKETAVALANFSVVHAQPDSDVVVLHCWHGGQMVLAFIPKTHVEDALRRDRLSGKQANLVVDRNLDVFAELVSEKYERGEYRPYSRFGSTLLRVDITSEEVEATRHRLTDSVLDIQAGWMGPDGRFTHA